MSIISLTLIIISIGVKFAVVLVQAWRLPLHRQRDGVDEVHVHHQGAKAQGLQSAQGIWWRALLVSELHSAVQFRLRWYLRSQKSPYTLHPTTQKCPQCHIWSICSVRLIDNGPISLFQERSPSASSFHTSLLQAVDGMMSLPLSTQVVSQAPQHLRSSTKQATCESCFTHQSTCSVISIHSGRSRAGQYTHMRFWRWMLTTDTLQSGLCGSVERVVPESVTSVS